MGEVMKKAKKEKVLVKISEVVGEVTLKTALSAIPIAGTFVSTIYDVFKDGIYKERFEKWSSIVEARLNKLEITVGELNNNENFATMLIKTTELAIKTSQKEKLDYLANALRNSITANLDEDRIIIFMALLEKHTITHINILKKGVETITKERKKINQFRIGVTPRQLIGIKSSVDKLEDSLFNKCYRDLFLDCLVVDLDISFNDHSVGDIVTNLGKEYLEFISIQKEAE